MTKALCGFSVSTLWNLLFMHGRRDVVFSASSNQPGVHRCTLGTSEDCLHHLLPLHAVWLKQRLRRWQVFWGLFFLCLMCLFLSVQLTSSSNLTMSHLQGSSGVSLEISLRVFLCPLHACFCVSEPVWEAGAGKGRMESGQRAVTPTPPACLCCSVSLSHQWGEEWLTVRRVSQILLCCPLCSRSGVCTLGTERSYAVMAWFFLGDWGAFFAALLRQQVTFWGICVCVSYRMTSSAVSDLTRRLVNPITYVQRGCLSDVRLVFSSL